MMRIGALALPPAPILRVPRLPAVDPTIMELLALRVPPLTASVPPSTVVPPKWLSPESVIVPAPTLTREPVPKIKPLTSVEELLPPTVSSLAPSRNEPAPAIEPALSLSSPEGPVLPEKFTDPPLLLVNAALPPVLVSKKKMVLLLVMPALPAVLVSWKRRSPLTPLVIVALPAVLRLLKSML